MKLLLKVEVGTPFLNKFVGISWLNNLPHDILWGDFVGFDVVFIVGESNLDPRLNPGIRLSSLPHFFDNMS